jgi:hypothetical protein
MEVFGSVSYTNAASVGWIVRSYFETAVPVMVNDARGKAVVQFDFRLDSSSDAVSRQSA